MIDPLNSVVYGNKGVDNIMNGMANFQEKYNDVFWIFGDFKVDNDCVVFDFKRYWTEQDGIYCSSASEVIKFNEKGLVTLIEYINLPSSPTLIGESYPDSRSMNLSEDRRIVEDTDSLYDWFCWNILKEKLLKGDAISPIRIWSY